MAASFVRCNPRTGSQILRLLVGKSQGTNAFPLHCQRIAASTSSLSSHVYILSRPFSSPASTTSNAADTQGTTQPSPPLEENENIYRECYIPITRQSLVRHIVQEKDFLTDAEKKNYPDFALALDSALVNKYHGVLQELKALFDPINPDKETMQTREWTRREKLDNEFWLLQKLEDVMDKANFIELPRDKVDRMLQEHKAYEKVRVSIDPNRYDVLRFWVLGHEIPEMKLTLRERILNKLLKRQPQKAVEYFKRVVVAIRLKKDSKLILKAFKEVPMHSIEMLLPDGTITMSALDKGVLMTTGGIAASGILAKMVTVLASINVDWTLLLTFLTGMITFRVWSTYKNRRNAYLVDVSRLLYFKNIANNRSLLTLLVDRAEDESFKETLLTYSFLLNSRPQVLRNKPADTYIMYPHKGGLTEDEVKGQIEAWVQEKTRVVLDFDTSEALRLLKELGLISFKNDKYEAMMLDPASRLLPQSPQSLIARRNTESDITEGYDRDEYLETEDEYKAEEQRARRYGWF